MFTQTYLLPIVMVIMVACEDAPIFPEQYTLDFNETAAIGPLKGTTTGTNYVDGKNNRQTMTRANGHHDRYCGSVYKFSDTPCTHRVLNGTPSLMQTKDTWTSPTKSTAASAVIALMGVEW